MSGVAVLTAAGGAAWEARWLTELAEGAHGVRIVRRCMDVVDLLAVAESGQGQAVLVSGDLRRLDADAVQRLAASGVAVVAVVDLDASEGVNDGGLPQADRLRAIGIAHVVSAAAHGDIVASVIETAVGDAVNGTDPDTGAAAANGGRPPSRAFALSTSAVELTGASPPTSEPHDGAARVNGAVIAIWGPSGGPGRTTVAVALADEIARQGIPTLLIDADVYGGAVATMLGLLDESSGVAAAARQASNGRLDTGSLTELCWQVEPTLQVLTGLPRADRWPELRPSAIGQLLSTARTMVQFTIVDLGFCLETDEELSFDTVAPRRNGATLAVLDEADVVLAVGAADPLGVARLVRGLDDLRIAQIDAPVWIVLNKVRSSATQGDPRLELAEAITRFAGQPPAAFLPWDQRAADAAVLAGQSLARAAPTSPLRVAIAELGSALTGQPRDGAVSRGRKTSARGYRRADRAGAGG
jgi:Mrp family chromosome partitioning ATPase